INMSYMFYYCSALTTLNLSSFDTSRVANMSYMFYYCSALITLDISSFNTSSVTNMSYMFNNCNHLTTVYVGNLWNTSVVINSANMFTSCSSLLGEEGTIYNASYVDCTYARIDVSDTPGYFWSVS
ncbi:MAG: BspA family leucine-rich repeat surface protein, partial [Clostridia bacterium]|nr:BspA family leucine-rich repeat surface protein [Clostridia bacterium]